MKNHPAHFVDGKLFSLASGGAIYIRDPHRQVSEEQLNGGQLVPFSGQDWALVHPYLEQNARLFDIPVAALLAADGVPCPPDQVYRKVAPASLGVLA